MLNLTMACFLFHVLRHKASEVSHAGKSVKRDSAPCSCAKWWLADAEASAARAIDMAHVATNLSNIFVLGLFKVCLRLV